MRLFKLRGFYLSLIWLAFLAYWMLLYYLENSLGIFYYNGFYVYPLLGLLTAYSLIWFFKDSKKGIYFVLLTILFMPIGLYYLYPALGTFTENILCPVTHTMGNFFGGTQAARTCINGTVYSDDNVPNAVAIMKYLILFISTFGTGPLVFLTLNFIIGSMRKKKSLSSSSPPNQEF